MLRIARNGMMNQINEMQIYVTYKDDVGSTSDFNFSQSVNCANGFSKLRK